MKFRPGTVSIDGGPPMAVSEMEVLLDADIRDTLTHDTVTNPFTINFQSQTFAKGSTRADVLRALNRHGVKVLVDDFRPNLAEHLSRMAEEMVVPAAFDTPEPTKKRAQWKQNPLARYGR